VPRRAANATAPELEAGAGPAPPTYTEARARFMATVAELRALELRKRTGDLLERRLVERRCAYWARRLQDSLIRWPARIAAEAAASLGVEEAALTRALDAHVRRLCRELAGERVDLDG
jgi:hypothetical protein